jgi:hypothetical protein
MDATFKFIDIWDEEYLFSFHPKNLSGMVHTKESDGAVGLR